MAFGFRETLQAFDRLLAQRGLRLDSIVVGGAALNLLGVISRETKDCDILHPSLGDAIQKASREFAKGIRASGGVLVEEWLNNGPATLVGDLPGAGRGGCRWSSVGRPSSFTPWAGATY